MSRHREHVERILELAKLNYETDGYLAPILILSGPRDALVVKMAASEQLAIHFAQVAGLLYPTRRDTDIVINIVEAWGRSYDKEEGEAAMETIRHGDLSRAAEAGDKRVYTVLVVQGVDPNDPSQDLTTTYAVDGPDAGKDAHWLEGTAEGRMPEMMRNALRVAKLLILPPTITTQGMLEMLATDGLIEGAIEPITWEADAS